MSLARLDEYSDSDSEDESLRTTPLENDAPNHEILGEMVGVDSSTTPIQEDEAQSIEGAPEQLDQSTAQQTWADAVRNSGENPTQQMQVDTTQVSTTHAPPDPSVEWWDDCAKGERTWHRTLLKEHTQYGEDVWGRWARSRYWLCGNIKEGSLVIPWSDTEFLHLLRDEGRCELEGKRLDGTTISKLRGLTVPATPSEEEMADWERAMERNPKIGDVLDLHGLSVPGCAIGPGCRVAAGEYSGFVLRILGGVEPLALVRSTANERKPKQSDRDLFDVLTPEYTNDSDHDVPLARLKRHLCGRPSRLRDDDRVEVVDGTHTGKSGRVASMEGTYGGALVTIEGDEEGPIEVDMTCVRRSFCKGDIVNVVFGPWKGVRGIIVDDREHGRMLEAGGIETAGAALPERPTLAEVVEGRRGPGVLGVLQEDLDFDLAAPHPLEEGGAPEVVGRQHRVLTEPEIQRRQRQTWEAFQGRDVLITFPHREKGRGGEVRGYRLEAAPPEDPFFFPAVLAVRAQAFNETWEIPEDQLVDPESRLPLRRARQVFRWPKLLQFGWTDPLKDNTLPARVSTPEPDEPVDDVLWAPRRPPPTVGDDGGLWLCCPNLANKRIDVEVILKTVGRVTGFQKAAAGKAGFIEVGPHGIGRCDVNKPVVVYGLGAKGDKIKLEPRWLKPMRRTLNPPLVTEDLCITSVCGRVVIIGPDAGGDNSRLGEYGETVPSPPAGTDAVMVRFALPPTESRVYHKASLCRSTNLDGVSTLRTFFV
ncbi:hypothetical protein C8R43DRAFT_1128775 [Mycena crocata]|nr:hypothetical protein C8R43DRAFT_1128775 [Mycena crocata]